MKENIIIKDARGNNLKNISIEIPKNKIVLITGVSGSGKSTLAFDTIYAEGQRRYVESLSAYARQFLQMMQKPEVSRIDGLSPAIAIDQKTVSKNPRSTVGTITEIYDYIRLLYARIGIPYSPATGKPISKQTSTEIIKKVRNLKVGTKILILAPIAKSKKGEFKNEFAKFQKKGFQRVFVNKKLYNIDEVPKLDKNKKHDIDIVIDRLIISKTLENRLADSIELCLNISKGLVYIYHVETKELEIFSSNFSCPISGFSLEEIEPRIFSFNSPQGACIDCDGLGESNFFDPELLIPNKNLSISEGAIKIWEKGINRYYRKILNQLNTQINLPLDIPFKQIDKKIIDILLYGSEEIFIEELQFKRFYKSKLIPFKGLLYLLQKHYNFIKDSWLKDDFDKYRVSKVCEKCNGYRLNPKSLSVRVLEKNIGEICNFSIEKLFNWFDKCQDRLKGSNKIIASPILKEILNRIKFLRDVGLDYLTLNRKSSTLSGGESQRIRLASQIGSGLTGVIYVLDEPSIGLHQKDNSRLLKTLYKLRDLGNSVIVVEHDEEAISAADYIIDIGPLAGVHGGEVVAKGNLKEVLKNQDSLTAQYLTGIKKISVPKKRRIIEKKKSLEFHGITTNNLKNINVKFPVGIFCCVTGVSGSGKSSLIIDTIYPALYNKLNNSNKQSGSFNKIIGDHYFDKIVNITQSPIGRTPRSNPATYTGTFTPIRDWFALLPEAKARGYKAGRFSFNTSGGRCESCSGDGVKKVEMHFLSDIYVKCEECDGSRYNQETLEIKYNKKNISDILNLSVEEALDFFKVIPNINNKLKMLNKVGLGYISIGQSATTLSGGEAQRIKIAKELSKKATGKTLYILDEPTTGLHFDDVKKLINVLQELVNSGNTVLVIEHNLDVIKSADWIVDLGKDGGINGGEIIAQGPPEKIVKVKESYTGKYLLKHLS
ncbi:MAG: excinuclease ABC subunit A [Pelagibacterales bacterium]|nr:excinuclease ABC subunit A [Pelagibacterales bacterium]OUU61983.1 MAG: excinuclease ABC subunit A [Alphaproteobacteria bacterium TMED62]|tara:strand:- start:846 stop:3668 length:2823 start_codon:yes stop_codon:yes gene_type:complete